MRTALFCTLPKIALHVVVQPHTLLREVTPSLTLAGVTETRDEATLAILDIDSREP